MQTEVEPVHASAPAAGHPDYVVLLHGLGRTRLSMMRLEWALKSDGYRVINLSYPSRRLSIEDLANQWLKTNLDREITDPTAKANFVTHSMGGIVLRQYLAAHTLTNLGRVVMLAPPNQGSELVDKLRRNWGYRLFTGVSGQELGTDAASVPRRLGRVNFELGVIAGDRSLNPLFSSWIPGPNDGKVSVKSAWVDGCRDLLVVHHSHTWLAWRDDVVSAVKDFLKQGRFGEKRKVKIGKAETSNIEQRTPNIE